MTFAVGIDLGTTNSAIARIDEHGKPVVILNIDGGPITPSVICFKDGDILIGETAKELQALGTWPVAAFFKRQMGDSLFIFHADGKDYTATELSAKILRKLKLDAEAKMGREITHAVITVPAYFRDGERKATIEAGTAAGFEVLQVINEPTAAAVAYGLNRQGANLRILVYDLGGGTFDVTLLELTQEAVKVRTSDGDHQLGGKDWDDRIIEFLAGRFQDEFGINPLEDAESLADLLIQAEDAKKRLTSFDSTTISLTHNGCRGSYRLERKKFEEITSDLMERTISLTKRVLEDQGVRPEELGGVLLVGGATRMPMVHRFIEATFGRPPMSGINVDEAVALGAAVVAAEQMQLRMSTAAVLTLRGLVKTIDVTNHSLGMIAISGDRTAYLNSIILPKNREIPCHETRPYQHRTRSRGANQLEVFMTQGETDSPADAAYLGRYLVHDIPHEHAGLTVIEVTFHYDLSGTVNVTARQNGSRSDLRVTVEDLPADIPGRFLTPPEMETVPEHVTAYLAFDLSGSMSGEPILEARKAAKGFLKYTDLAHCSVGVIGFADQVKTKVGASQNARSIEHAIDGLTVGEAGYGNSTHPFGEILDILAPVEGKRFAIVLADGVWSHQETAVQYAKACHKAGIDVIAIGFGGADREFLRKIASSDEGSYFTSMNSLVETFSTIAQVLTETGGGGVSNLRAGEKGKGSNLFSTLRGALRL